MSTNLQDSPSVSYKELALVEGDSVVKVTPTINKLYSLNIDSDLYENRYAFKGPDGYLTICFVNLKNAETEWVFKNTNENKEDEVGTLDNPKNFIQKEVVSNFPIFINTAKEIDFLKEVSLDVRFNSSSATEDKDYQLMNVLNAYGIGNSWTSVPSKETTTAYFILRYFGAGDKAPPAYCFNPSAQCIAIVDLLNNNVYTTYALIVR